jgi:F-type H+-transporting ATPase subunit b
VGGVIEGRRRHIDGDLSSAEDARRSAESERAAYERMLAEARARAQAEGREAHARAAAESDARRKALEADLNEKLAAADRQIDATKQRAMASVADIARDAVAPIVERLLGRPVDSAVVARALNEQEG